MPVLAVTAGQRTAEQAAEIAAQFTNQQPRLRKALNAPCQAAQLRLVHQAMKETQNEAAFYVFNQADEKGFVIVSADDRTAEDILVYSEKGAFDAEKINPAFAWWLSRFADEISSIEDEDAMMANAPAAKMEVTPIEPLLVNKDGIEITWAQESPYNIYCPRDQRDNTKCYTGCVATAAAQIMYKWCWPIKGTGSSSYTWYDCLTQPYWGGCTNSYDTILSANYGETTYQWDLMRPAYQGKNTKANQRQAVALLMYHCGVASEMNYGGDAAGGSGTLTDYMAYGLEHYLGYEYDKYITMYPKSAGESHDGVPTDYNVKSATFIELFNQDLEAGRPILMGGGDNNFGGHAFVCDGRDKDNKFHINWGWEGDNNCYTAITVLQPEGESYKFKNGVDAVIGLHPAAPYAVENTEAKKENVRKVLQNGQVIIVRDNVRYTILGQAIQ